MSSRRVNCCYLCISTKTCHTYYLLLIFIYLFAFITTTNLEGTEPPETISQLLSVESLNPFFDALLFAANITSSSSSIIKNNSKNLSAAAELLCNAQENSMCENARMCRRRENATDFECVCRRGHAGKYCQFSLFPRNCADAFAFHEEVEEEEEDIFDGGVWQLDVDGSAPLPPTYAECKMINGDVVTVVSNNVPSEGAVVRTKDGIGPADAQNVFFPISYRLFSSSQLSALISRSHICKQPIRFDCEHSPLGFKYNRTWLEVVAHDDKQHRQIGTHQQFSCACRNKELYGCGRDNPALACYCDDLAQPIATDQATLYNASAGVSAIYFRASKGHQQQQKQQLKQMQQLKGAQNFTLGPVECSGEAGTSLPGAVVTLRSPSVGIGTDPMGQWRQLEFDFRTGQPDIEQIVAGWDPADNGLQMKISLRAGYRIELTLSHQANIEQAEKSAETDDNMDTSNDNNKVFVHQQKRGIRREMSVSIASQRPLNDLFWHRVLVEVFRGEIRFSVDRLNAFQPLSFPFATSTKFSIGGDEKGNGFVGCIGNFQIDQMLHDWTQQLAQKDRDEDVRVVSGCLELCAENKCEQGSKCVEHFDTETTSCACKLPRIHYGEHCEKNINENSSATFRGGSSGFLRFFNLPISALHSDVIFSIRTDQRRALLLYEHDQADNFVQIHLADDYRIVLTMNNLSSIVSCSVFAPPIKTFNDMRWLQLILERSNEPGATSPQTVVLHVDDDQCQIGPVLLNDPDSTDHQNGLSLMDDEEKTVEEDDAILPPAPPVPPEKVRPFQILFVGGMPRAKRTLRQKRERMPVYLSNLPPLKGCIRGLMVDGEMVDLWHAVSERKLAQNRRSEAVEIGCDHIQCDDNSEQLNCQNGGQCAVNWRNTAADGNNRQKTRQCDCTKSSFVGTNCTEDVGLSFVGNSAVVFDMSEPKRFAFLQHSERQTLSLAFSCAKISGQNLAQHLATINFDDGREFHIVLDRNGSLFVGIFGLDRRPMLVHHIPHIFNDGFRHHFRVHFLSQKIQLELAEPFGPRRIWTIQNEGINLANAQQFYFGGPKNGGKIGEEMAANDSNSNEDESSESGSVEGEKKQQQQHYEQNANANAEQESALASTNTDSIDNDNDNNHPPDSVILADAMREILARRSANANEQNENGQQRHMDKIGTATIKVPNAKSTTASTEFLWPQQIVHFVGCISNVLVVFENDLNLITFTPFLYYLQKSELLHRNVFVVPSDDQPKQHQKQQLLAPMACGQFKVPEMAKKSRRNVTFPVWEAPFGPIAFHENDVSSEKLIKTDQTDEAINEKGNSFVHWLFLIFLLLILLAFCLFLISLICRRKIRQRIGRTYYVLQKSEPKNGGPTFEVLKTTGPIKKRRFGSRTDSMEPIQLAQHKRFFPLEGSFSATPPVTPTAPLLFAEQKPILRPILRHLPPPRLPSSSITDASPHTQSANENDGIATSSSSTIYYTAQEEQFAAEEDNSSTTISFKSLDEKQTSSGDEDSTTIGQAFEENAPELMDERTRQLSAALSSSYGGSSNFSFANLIGEAEAEKRNLPGNL